MSSHLEKEKYPTNVRVNKSPVNGLHKDSIVKCDYIYNIPSRFKELYDYYEKYGLLNQASA